ncbi:uncharacterized protein LOC142336997 isoform X1 [Convolutriloba macropyga]|uniref:uncharacterized protein LOC142336997 isoform X1 n=1 Tax=Convolutriloba macropyga TaxID=536237 RepID=UPI003F51BF46
MNKISQTESYLHLAAGFFGVSFILTFFAHPPYGWKYGDVHGGLWQACGTTCVDSADTGELRAAQAFFILDHLVCLIFCAVLVVSLLTARGLLQTPALRLSWLVPVATIIGFIHFAFLLTACITMTVEYKKYNDDYSTGISFSWGTIVPWLGSLASLTLLPVLLFAVYMEKSEKIEGV